MEYPTVGEHGGSEDVILVKREREIRAAKETLNA
jgi:hypothetical protein